MNEDFLNTGVWSTDCQGKVWTLRFLKKTSSNGTAKGSTRDQACGPGAQASVAHCGPGGWELRRSWASGLPCQLPVQAPVPPKTTPSNSFHEEGTLSWEHLKNRDPPSAGPAPHAGRGSHTCTTRTCSLFTFSVWLLQLLPGGQMEWWSAPEGRTGFSLWSPLLDPWRILPGSRYGVSLVAMGEGERKGSEPGQLWAPVGGRHPGIPFFVSRHLPGQRWRIHSFCSETGSIFFQGHPTGEGVCPWEAVRDGPVLQEGGCAPYQCSWSWALAAALG